MQCDRIRAENWTTREHSTEDTPHKRSLRWRLIKAEMKRMSARTPDAELKLVGGTSYYTICSRAIANAFARGILVLGLRGMGGMSRRCLLPGPSKKWRRNILLLTSSSIADTISIREGVVCEQGVLLYKRRTGGCTLGGGGD